MLIRLCITLLATVAVFLLAGCLGNDAGKVAVSPSIRPAPDFPSDPARRHENNFEPTGAFRKLSDNLYVFEDCANVYVVKSGDRALLVDFGSGEVMERLCGIGVTGVDHVLVTHHHRNQVQGLCELDSIPFAVTVPEKEAHFFESVRDFWNDLQIYINYNCRSHWNTLRKSIRVDNRVNGGDEIVWNGIRFTVIETPGNTDHSVSYTAVIDGRRVAFTGDLIAGPGKLVNWYDFHWNYYGFTQGIDASDRSFERLREWDAELLLPSHGAPVSDPAAAMAVNSGIYEELRGMLVPNQLQRQQHQVRQILPHLVYVGKNCYAIISDSGKAFLYDYGYVEPEWIWMLKSDYGVKSIDVVSYSHYHDDHNIRTYEPVREGAKLWVFENMLDVFENPSGYKLPCLVPFPILADRVLTNGEKVRWEEYEFEFIRQPGQTEFHQALKVTVDGKKVMFTGDNTWNKRDHDKVRNGPVVPQNEYFLDGGFITCARTMLDYMPDLVCPAHTEEYSPSREDLEGFLGWAERLREVMTGLIDQPDPNFGMDYHWCRFYPYRSVAGEGEEFELSVFLRNHLFVPAEVKLVLKASEGLEVLSGPLTFRVDGKKQVGASFRLRKLPGHGPDRQVVTVDVTINGRRLGEVTEALVDSRKPWRM